MRSNDNNHHPLLSIIIPLYNYEGTIGRAILSVLEQRVEGIELIVVDDGSTDGSASVVEGILRDYEFKLLKKENGGASSARNVGLEIANANFIAFLDADDEFLPNGLNCILKAIKNSDADVFLFGHVNRFPTGKTRSIPPKNIPKLKRKAFLQYARGDIGASFGSVAFNAHVFDEIKFPEGIAQAEDFPVFALMFALFNCEVFPDNVCVVNKHNFSRRRSVDGAKEAGQSVVNYLFDHKCLPSDFQSLKSIFQSQRSLSIFRTLWKANCYSDACDFYIEALNQNLFEALRWKYLRKYLRCWCLRIIRK